MRPSLRLPTQLLVTAILAAAAGCGSEGDRVTSGGLIADHTTVDAAGIPQAALSQAWALRMSFSHASVGGNIWDGLTALQASDEARYAFPNWADNARGNPGWQAKVDDFETFVAANQGSFDVFQNKFCYIDQDADFAYYRDSMLALEAAYPTKTFVWWTMPLMTSGTDNALRAAFNQQVRAYCAAHGKPLFDLAAIESHTALGAPVTEGGNEAMDPTWSSDGGHLNAAGADRAAQAMWWLMARLSGWGG